MKAAEISAMLCISTRITLSSSQLSRALDDETIAAHLAELQKGVADLVEFMAARRPCVIYALARYHNAPRQLPLRLPPEEIHL